LELALIIFKKNFFISFEGPEASGKSSQIKLLSNFLDKNNIPNLVTREPGGTKLSEKLRKIILNNNELITVNEEILLLMAARMNHLNKIIFPALKAGKIVISDRYVDSTFVYQGFVNNYGIKEAKDLHKKLLNNFLPNKTFLFILPPTQIIKRLKQRKISNKYDKMDINFHKKVNKGYKILSQTNKRFHIINAKKSIQNIHEEILKVLFNNK
jgi:dTMP kinase